jgi:hypothetical protein
MGYKRADFFTEVADAYWRIVLTAAFLVPRFRRQLHNEALQNIVWLLDRAGLGAPIRSPESEAFFQQQLAALPNGSTASLILKHPNPYAAAQWLCTQYVILESMRQQSGMPANAPLPILLQLPFVRLFAIYTQQGWPTTPHTETLMHAHLRTQFSINLVEELTDTERIQHALPSKADVTTLTQPAIFHHYNQKIFKKFQGSIFPSGRWNDYWYRPVSPLDTDQIFRSDAHTLHAVAKLAEMICTLALTHHGLTVWRPLQQPGWQRHPDIQYALRLLIRHLLRHCLFVAGLHCVARDQVHAAIAAALPRAPPPPSTAN